MARQLSRHSSDGFEAPGSHAGRSGDHHAAAAAVTFSIVDFGALFYVYLALENGVSQATRYAVTGNLMIRHPARPRRGDSIKAAMRQATPTLTIPDGAFTFEHMPVGGSTWLGGAGGPDEIEKVTVDYTWAS